MHVQRCPYPALLPEYDRYSFGIGRYIGLTDKENALSVSVLADTVFYIGSFTDTAQPYFTWCNDTFVLKILTLLLARHLNKLAD